jgi:hypothetical protein
MIMPDLPNKSLPKAQSKVEALIELAEILRHRDVLFDVQENLLTTPQAKNNQSKSSIGFLKLK